jgi:hypothetical protein
MLKIAQSNVYPVVQYAPPNVASYVTTFQRAQILVSLLVVTSARGPYSQISHYHTTM